MRSKNNTARHIFALLMFASCGIVAGAANETVWAGQPTTPADRANYDEVGYASWYGHELAGNRTGNGEAFAPLAISGAHRMLPMPSFVEVTNLETGRTILVRINDRGPVSKDRIMDLSLGAARQLGVEGKGVFPVRVRRVNPPEFERRALQAGGMATERLPTPPALLKALRKRLGTSPAVASDGKAKASVPAARPAERRAPVAPAARSGGYYVQVGAFSTEARAGVAARQVGGSIQPAGKYWRVRTGPYASEAAAKAALGPVAAKGYRDARITR